MVWPIKYEFVEESHGWRGKNISIHYHSKFHGKYYIPVIYRVLIFSLFHQKWLTLQYYWRKLKGNKSINIRPINIEEMMPVPEWKKLCI